jgi:hypothetical protein
MPNIRLRSAQNNGGKATNYLGAMTFSEKAR